MDIEGGRKREILKKGRKVDEEKGKEENGTRDKGRKKEQRDTGMR